MENVSKQVIYLVYVGAIFLLCYYLGPVLTPFLLGTLFAYLMKPLVAFLDKRKVPHLVSVLTVFTLLVVALVTTIVLVYPLVQKQLHLLGQVIPAIFAWVTSTLIPYINEYVDLSSVQDSLTSSLPKAGQLFATVLSSGYAVIEWGINLVLTPVIAFYLLRDWDEITQKLQHFVPRKIKPNTLLLASQFDEILASFFRGQLIIMLCLSLIYSIGLALVGLKVGIMIGLIAGVLSIIPYLGSLFVLVAASAASVVEYGTAANLFMVLAVFLFGQAIEGYILTPTLIGKRIGLHPIAVIFSVMAGGALFGFFGVLLALPVAALLAAVLRFAAG